jgi:hypothetical protein
MSAFDSFLKKKKKGPEEEDKAKAPTPPKKGKKAPKPKAEPKPKSKPKSEPKTKPKAAKKEAEASVEEATEEVRREDADTEEEPEKPKVPKPPKKAAPPPPKPNIAEEVPAKTSAPAPSSGPTPIAAYTYEELAEQVQVSDYGDTYDEDSYGGKESITVVGEKGSGKSTMALSFEGKKLVISYDRMAIRNKYKMRDPENIKVIDPMTLYDASSPARKRDSMCKILEYLIGVEEYPEGPRNGGLLEEMRANDERPDWVIHDGTDILMEICEMSMRKFYDLLPSQGVEWNMWKIRKSAIQDVYHKSLNLAKRGIIFTTYFTEKQMDEDITGQKKTKEMPKWMDIILHQTLHTIVVFVQGENFYLRVQQSKSVKKDVTGQVFDVTGVAYESDEVDPKTKEKIWKLDLEKLYEVVDKLDREVL